jgi:hypothetical protein
MLCSWCNREMSDDKHKQHINKAKCLGLPNLVRLLLKKGASWENSIFINDYFQQVPLSDFNKTFDDFRFLHQIPYQGKSSK